MIANNQVSLFLLVQLLTSQQTASVKLDNKFFELFSLTHVYDQLKYGNIAHLLEVFQTYHLSEDTARLLYAFARAFVRTEIKSVADYRAQPYSLSGLADKNVCNKKKRYDDHMMPDIGCYFNLFTICVEGALMAPDSCLHATPDHASCSQSKQCGQVYATLLFEKNPAWLQLWASDTHERLKEYKSKTAEQIALEYKKTCLHDSQFLSAVFNLAICSEVSRQVSFTKPREVHPLAEIFCPDPCLQSPCAKPHLKHQLIDAECISHTIKWESQHAIAHRWDDLKLQREQKARPQYTCNCRIGTWVAAKESCEREEGGSMQTCSPTMANKHFPCDLRGTSVCFNNQGSEEAPFICQCKLGFTGILCQEPINPCLHKSVEITLYGKVRKMTGNRICNANKAGESKNANYTAENACISAPDARYGFTCKCNYPYYQIIRLETDNCLGVSRACDERLCLNGDCVSTPDFVTASGCRCHPGWGGQHCNLTLNDWGIWTSCQPVCGTNRTRRRTRLGDRVDFTRLFKEIELCPNRYCRDDTDETEYTAYQTLLYASAADSSALTACLLIAMLIFALLRFWRPRFISKEARKV